MFKAEISMLEAGHGWCIHALRAQRFYSIEFCKVARGFLLSGLCFFSSCCAARGRRDAEEHVQVCAWEQDLLPLGPQTFAIGLHWILHHVSSHQFSAGRAKPGDAGPQSRGSLAGSDTRGWRLKTPGHREQSSFKRQNQLSPALILSLSAAFVTTAWSTQAKQVSLFK